MRINLSDFLDLLEAVVKFADNQALISVLERFLPESLTNILKWASENADKLEQLINYLKGIVVFQGPEEYQNQFAGIEDDLLFAQALLCDDDPNCDDENCDAPNCDENSSCNQD